MHGPYRTWRKNCAPYLKPAYPKMLSQEQNESITVQVHYLSFSQVFDLIVSASIRKKRILENVYTCLIHGKLNYLTRVWLRYPYIGTS